MRGLSPRREVGDKAENFFSNDSGRASFSSRLLESTALAGRSIRSVFFKFLKDERGFVAITGRDISDLVGAAAEAKKNGTTGHILDIELPEDMTKTAGPFWQTVLFKVADIAPETLQTAAKILDEIAKPENTHGEIAKSAFASMPSRARKFLYVDVVSDFTKHPDIKAILDDIRAGNFPGRKMPHGGLEHFYNPDIECTEMEELDGVKGLGKMMSAQCYENVLNALWLLKSEYSLPKRERDYEKIFVLTNYASAEAGKLSHYISDICVWHHSDGELVEGAWVSSRIPEHALLEAKMARKKYDLRVLPGIITEKSGGVAERYEQEARLSRKYLLSRKNPLNEENMKQMYRRAVQFTADTFYTALVHSRLLDEMNWLDEKLFKARAKLPRRVVKAFDKIC